MTDTPSPAAGRPLRRVLIAEDEPTIRALIEASLEGLPGCELQAVTDGLECLAAITPSMPDLLLLDIRMPGMNGHDVCATLRAQPSAAGLTIIMLSAVSQETDIAQARNAGADDFLLKPFAPADLRARVSEALDWAS